MHFSRKANKGVIDRTFVPVKVALHRESSHADVLSKCIQQVNRVAYFLASLLLFVICRFGKMIWKKITTLQMVLEAR